MTEPTALEQASDPTTPADRLQALASHAGLAVRVAVAANPSSGRLTVEALLRRASEGAGLADLAGAVLGNASLPLWLLEDPGWLHQQTIATAMALARSPSLSALAWAALGGHESLRLKLGLLRSAAAPPDAWVQLGLPTRGRWRLAACSLADQVVALLTLAPPLALESLDLSSCSLGDEAATGLARLTTLGPLTELNLASNRVGDEGLRALIQSASLAGLRRLDLSNNLVTVQGARSLARSPLLASLTSLDLRGNPLGARGRKALLKAAVAVPGLTIEP